ncbi:hypothetical protein ANCCEY_09482 [Ancylostoma ceylanicum]|uniref:Uncharacterized protein n=1 Tax=Ancylostoma ceylanicum TaxID=53326 RepID=A0A0D6LHH3_9BILA|nr:hypothetical protein ANCCEY_09482 [Ancylostoma ceylanicum]
MGQLMRLDDNGSWQQQCFRCQYLQTFCRATVVKHQTMFWVKSVVSNPIPPCRVSKSGYPNYVKPLPTPPPPVKQFKMDTNKVFGNDRFQPHPHDFYSIQEGAAIGDAKNSRG